VNILNSAYLWVIYLLELILFVSGIHSVHSAILDIGIGHLKNTHISVNH